MDSAGSSGPGRWERRHGRLAHDGNPGSRRRRNRGRARVSHQVAGHFGLDRVDLFCRSPGVVAHALTFRQVGVRRQRPRRWRSQAVQRSGRWPGERASDRFGHRPGCQIGCPGCAAGARGWPGPATCTFSGVLRILLEKGKHHSLSRSDSGFPRTNMPGQGGRLTAKSPPFGAKRPALASGRPVCVIRGTVPDDYINFASLARRYLRTRAALGPYRQRARTSRRSAGRASGAVPAHVRAAAGPLEPARRQSPNSFCLSSRRCCASSDRVAVGRASSRGIPIGSPVSSQ